MVIKRRLESFIKDALKKGRSILLLGPRQTGKTTLLNQIDMDMSITLAHPQVRLKYEKDPGLLIQEIEQHQKTHKKIIGVILDEVQKVPALMDSVQYLIDKQLAQFIITGSSARKLKRGSDVNLLPGRVLSIRMAPLTQLEYSDFEIEDLLNYGSLPRMTQLVDRTDRERELDSYVTTYLEEEIRAEALVRNIGQFARFLEMAAIESGHVVNFSKISQDIGISHTTIASFYSVLEDCLITERVDPLTISANRKKLTKASKHLFFDLGVRRLAAKENCARTPQQFGPLFEQWVGLEILHQRQNFAPQCQLKFWRDPDGPEVDWVLKNGETLTPIEVKWSETPQKSDVRHLEVFLNEYPQAQQAYVVCRTQREFSLGPRISAISWKHLSRVFG